MREKVVGAVLGAAVGDAVGCPFEFQSQAAVRARFPATPELPWIDDLYAPRGIDIHPLGLWQIDPPCGVSTDDTRMSWLLLELTAQLGRAPHRRELAQRYLDVYERPDSYFPTGPNLARQGLGYYVGAACATLDRPSPAHPQATPEALRSGALGLGIPTLLGMISLPGAGLFAIGDPLAAYQQAFELAFMDVGIARDITAVHAAIVSLVAADLPLPEAVPRAFGINPFGVDSAWRARISDWFAGSEQLPTDRALCAWLAERCCGLHPFDPVAALGTALCCAQRAGRDFRRAILLATNQWELSHEGQPRRLADVDCFASITGSISGALAGRAAIPQAWLQRCQAANRIAYGFDIVDSAERFADAICVAPADGPTPSSSA